MIMTRTKHDLRHYQPFEPFTKEKPVQTNARGRMNSFGD